MAKAYEKMIDEIGKMTIIELSEFIDDVKEKFNVSDMPVVAAGAAAPAAGQAAVAEEKSEYKVTLQAGGPEKIKTIKALRKVTALNLSDAKKAVEDAPTVIAESASKDDAQKMKKELEEIGAKVELS